MRRTLFKKDFNLRISRQMALAAAAVLLLLSMPIAAHASPFDTGIANVSTLFTGVVARFASLIAVVMGGLGFAFGDPGAKKNLSAVAFGVGIALLAAQVISWLWAA